MLLANNPASQGSQSLNIPAYAQVIQGQADRPMGQVVLELQETERLAMALNDEIGSLEARLQTVLRPVPTESQSAGGNTPAPVRSECANAVAELNRQLQRALYRVREMAARADL